MLYKYCRYDPMCIVVKGNDEVHDRSYWEVASMTKDIPQNTVTIVSNCYEIKEVNEQPEELKEEFEKYDRYFIVRKDGKFMSNDGLAVDKRNKFSYIGNHIRFKNKEIYLWN